MKEDSYYTAMNKTIDHLGARVVLAGLCGAVGGGAFAMYKGHLIPRSAGLSCLSCAMVATACFSFERVVHFAIETTFPPSQQQQTNFGTTSQYNTTFIRTMSSHVIGGIIGGAYTGMLYIRRPIRGVLFLTPIMGLIGIGEFQFQKMRQERAYEIIEGQQAFDVEEDS